jgi:hypothetical protein
VHDKDRFAGAVVASLTRLSQVAVWPTVTYRNRAAVDEENPQEASHSAPHLTPPASAREAVR